MELMSFLSNADCLTNDFVQNFWGMQIEISLKIIAIKFLSCLILLTENVCNII